MKLATSDDQQPTDQQMSVEERWRKHRLRQIAAFVTLPGLVIGTASIAAAYSAGLFSPKPVASCHPTIVPAPARGSFTIQVLNATGKDGRATTVGHDLTRRSFKVKGVANAPESLLVRDPAVVYHGAKGLDAALLVASQIKGATLFDDGRAGAGVDLVLGLAYTNLVAVPPAPPPTPRQIKLNVYNTTYKTGLAKVVADKLLARGFHIGEVANDPLRTMQTGTAGIRYGQDGDAAAKVVAEQVPSAHLVLDKRTDKSVDLVIGNAYKELVPLSQLPPPPPTPPKVTPTVSRPCTPSH